MQKKDIKAGVLYGYAKGTSDYRNASPMIVLDAKSLWTWHRSHSQGNRQWGVSSEKRYTSGSSGWSSWQGPHGYLVLDGCNYSDPEEAADHLATLARLYGEFAATAGDSDAVNALAAKVKDIRGITLDVVNNRWITGDYVEVKNEELEREKARRAKHKAERDRSAAETDLLAEVAEALSSKLERSVSVHTDRSWGYNRASINLEDLAAYFGIKSVQDRL